MHSKRAFNTYFSTYQASQSEYLDILFYHSHKIIELHIVLAGTEYSAAEPLSSVAANTREEHTLISQFKEGKVAAVSIDFEMQSPSLHLEQGANSHHAPILTADLNIDHEKFVTIESNEITWFHTGIHSWKIWPASAPA